MSPIFYLLTALIVTISCSHAKHIATESMLNVTPSIPAWPDQFMINLDIYVEKYGKDWSSTGRLYYDWDTKTFRADYIDWCLPLFDTDTPSEDNDYTCTFLATQGNMYFVNHTAHDWHQYECCMFEKGLAAVPPDWMKECIYNGTAIVKDITVDVWWFPGTNDPEKPCYGYWNAQDERHTPVQFFGLSSIGPTILSYRDFEPKSIPHDIEMGMPNVDCNKDCEPPLMESLLKNRKHSSVKWPEWPSCE